MHRAPYVSVLISTTMIAQARELNAGISNCEWIVNAVDDLRQFDDGSFDLVLTHLVHRHHVDGCREKDGRMPCHHPIEHRLPGLDRTLAGARELHRPIERRVAPMSDIGGSGHADGGTGPTLHQGRRRGILARGVRRALH